MSTVQVKSKDQIKAELKEKNPDWNDQKLSMQAGRAFAKQQADAAEEKHRSKIAEQIRAEKPDLDDAAVEKEITARIQREKEQVQLTEASNLIQTTRDAYEKAVFDYATMKTRLESKHGIKSSGLPKDVKDKLIKEINSL